MLAKEGEVQTLDNSQFSLDNYTALSKLSKEQYDEFIRLSQQCSSHSTELQGKVRAVQEENLTLAG